jgi:WD40 repeat protein
LCGRKRGQRVWQRERRSAVTPSFARLAGRTRQRRAAAHHHPFPCVSSHHGERIAAPAAHHTAAALLTLPLLLAPQRPLLLSGHERALNQIKFNREGDLLFSCSKDNVVNVWYSHNGERLGTYEGNNGSVWSIDPDREWAAGGGGADGSVAREWRA